MWLQVVAALALVHTGFAQYDYGDVLGKSILFFEAQRSGPLPPSNRIGYRRDSATNDGEDVGIWLGGGWYDAGDHVKFGFPMAATATLLAWSILDFKEGYQKAGQYDWALDEIKWATDYFLNCNHHLGQGENKFWVQCADGYADHAFWGRPEDMTMFRPSFAVTDSAPGSDVAGETAAAMAAAGMVFKDAGNNEYGELLIEVAKTLYNFAYNFRGKYSDSLAGQVMDFYGSTGYDDELCSGALWLYRATGDQDYLNKAMEFYNAGVPWALSWDEKTASNQILAYIVTQDGQYLNHAQAFVNSYKPGGGITYTPAGLAWRDTWGPNRYAANAAFIAMMTARFGGDMSNADWAKTQLDYMLGSNNYGRSYVIGYGSNPPTRPHHRSSSCNPDPNVWCDWGDYNRWEPNPSELTGALVGGPDEWDNYDDRRDDYIANEVACDYNAGFQGAIAGAVQFYQ